MDFKTSETERRMHNVCRMGKVVEADYANARLKVDSGGIVTDWLAWAVIRAGPDITWWAPEIGDQVILLSPSGEMEDAVIVGSLYQNAYPAPGDHPNVHTTLYQDGTTIEYDRQSHKLTANVIGDIDIHCDGDAQLDCGGNVKMKAQHVTIDAPQVSITGHLSVSNGISTSVDSGRGIVSTGTIEVIGGDMIAEGISLTAHRHSGVQTGSGNTGQPI